LEAIVTVPLLPEDPFETLSAALVVLFWPMAVARFAAMLIAVSVVAKCVLSVVPLVPVKLPLNPVTPADRVLLREKLPTVPLLVAVIVTAPLLLLAVTPMDEQVVVISVTILVASVVRLLLVANFAVARDGQVFEPSDPPVTEPHEKTLLAGPTVNVGVDPGVTWVTCA
jgi:hypothetical protein